MKNFWNWLNGKKRDFAHIYWTVVVLIVPIIFDHGVPDNVDKAMKVIGVILTSMGFGHAAVKNMKKKG